MKHVSFRQRIPYLRIAVHCGLLSLTSLWLAAADRYVDPGSAGNDSADGSLSTPWKTLGKANATLVAGDTVHLMAGTYAEPVQPANSGTGEGTRITYTNYEDDVVTITGSASIGNGEAALLGSKAYITLDGLRLNSVHYTTLDTNFSVAAQNSAYVKFLNCEVVNGHYTDPSYYREKAGGISLQGADHGVVDGCKVVGWKVGISVGGGSTYNVVRNSIIQNNHHHEIHAWGSSASDPDLRLLIENNHIGGSMTSDGVQTDCAVGDAIYNRKIIIRNNYFYYNGEDHIDLKAAGEVVVENNIMVAAVGDNDGYGYETNPSKSGLTVERWGFALNRGSNRIAGRVILRGNVIYDNNKGFGSHNDDWKCYNNVFAANTRDYTGWNSTYDGEQTGHGVAHVGATGFHNAGGVFLNNICIDHKLGEIQFKRYSSTDPVLTDYNLYHNTRPEGLRFLRQTSNYVKMSDQTVYTTLAQLQTYLDTDANVAGGEDHSMVADPLFQDVPRWPAYPYFNYKQAVPLSPVFMSVIEFGDRSTWFPYDFQLQSGSPAIDAGRPLTYADGSGSGTSLVVEDSGVFCDGYGVVSADSVQIGSNAPILISSINYATNTITLTHSATWSDGDPVSLPYEGTAPDIGAFEYTGGSVPTAPSGLGATALSSAEIALAWTDNASDETGFKIERKIGIGGTFSQIVTLSANTTSYNDTGLDPSTSYYYRVAATNGAGSSPWSGTASATTGGSSTETTFSAVHDAFLQNGNRYDNSELRVENGVRITYLQFDLTGLSGTLTATTLRLTTSDDNGSGTLRVFLGDSNSWTESNLSTGNAPTSTGEVGSRSGTFAQNTTYDWDLSGAASGNGTLSLIIMQDSGGNDVSFYSDEASVAASLKPQLIVTTGAVNPPPTVALTSPADEATYVLGETIPLVASASDDDGIALVEFHHGGSTLIADDDTAPFAFNWVPAGTGAFVLTATAHDGGSPVASTVSAGIDVTVVANSVPVITTASLPGGEEDTAYSQALGASGGNGTLTWSLDSGSLPAGLSLSGSGVISGTPTTAGTANFAVQVADTDGNTGSADEDTQALAITIVGDPVETTFSPTHDAFLQNGNRYNNDVLRVENGVRIAYLQFDVTGLSGTVLATTLRLTSSDDNGSGTFRVFLGDSNGWTESNLSTGNAPGSAGEVGNRSGTFAQYTTYDWSLSGAVSGNGTISLLIMHDSGGNDVSFHSDEASVATSLKPQLIVTTQ